MSAEERKEARAHRNRIAAQNSRDRRKAEFATLSQRVAELEEENRQLRAGMGMASSPRHADTERAKWERENEELKERIKSLEQGWDTIVKALAAQGLPTGKFTRPRINE
jgi:cell division protein FtsB